MGKSGTYRMEMMRRKYREAKGWQHQKVAIAIFHHVHPRVLMLISFFDIANLPSNHHIHIKLAALGFSVS